MTTLPSAKEAYEKYQKVLLNSIPEKHLDAIAASINRAIQDQRTWTVYTISVDEEGDSTNYSLKRTISEYLNTLGYDVDCRKSLLSEEWIIHIQWDKKKN